MHAALAAAPLREMVSASDDLVLRVQRERALVGAWYEFFPRSEGATYDPATETWRTGTLRTAAERLPAIAAMGFDVVYLTPVHPIGTSNRKGRNNTLDPLPTDPGSPYAIGSPDGGHDAIDPTLGTFEDFDDFVARARELGLEVALDLALQCSPDHPWVTEHPEWFTTRADGTIAYAENPPKKYQDIYPLNFDNDPEGIYREVLRVVLQWVEHGVTLFRVDNPHTKPVQFWEWLIAQVNAEHPEVIFLAEAFTRPAMMHTLGKVGFHQSYTYFTWRNTKDELTEYLTELSGGVRRLHAAELLADDARHPHARTCSTAGGPRSSCAPPWPPRWCRRTGSTPGYELVENVARPGRRGAARQREVRVQAPGLGRGGQGPEQPRRLADPAQRDPARPPCAATAAQHRLPPDRRRQRDLLQPQAHRRPVADRREDLIIVVANLDPHGIRETTVHLDMPRLGHGLARRLRGPRPGHRTDLALG